MNASRLFSFQSFLLVSLLTGLVFLVSACTGSAALQQQTTQTLGAAPTQIESQDLAAVQAESDQEAEAFVRGEEFAIGLLFMAALVSIITQRLRIPYTIGLVVVGLGLALITRTPLSTPITPELILALLVPPLIFEAAFHLNFSDFRSDLGIIALLAVPGVLITTLLVAGIVYLGAAVTLPTALIFGSIVAATDPVAVIALLRSLGVPKRLEILLESESLFNDGTAIVLFSLMLALAGIAPLRVAGITIDLQSPTGLLSGIVAFIIVAGGGLLVGSALGILVSALIERIDNYLIEITLTTVLAYGSFLIAEEFLHVSGVLAVVAAGLATGTTGQKGMSPTTRIVLFNFWEYAAFLANSFIFLLIGLEISLNILLNNLLPIFWALLAVLLARGVIAYGLTFFSRNLPVKWKHILFWGDLRGAISLALALSLAAETPDRAQIQAMAFGIVLFTLLVKGLTVGPLIHWLKLSEQTESQQEYERRHAKAAATRSAYLHLEKLNQDGLLSDFTWQYLAPALERRSKMLTQAVRESLIADPTLRAQELADAWREALRSQRSELTSLHRDGAISEEIFSELVAEVDAQLEDPHTIWSEVSYPDLLSYPQVERLIAAVVQFQDSESAATSLEAHGFSVTRLPSVGGFLGRTNVTLLIGLPAGQEEQLVGVLQSTCRKRVEYLASPLEGSTVLFSTPIPVNVGGATIFTFAVERYEEF